MMKLMQMIYNEKIKSFKYNKLNDLNARKNKLFK